MRVWAEWFSVQTIVQNFQDGNNQVLQIDSREHKIPEPAIRMQEHVEKKHWLFVRTGGTQSVVERSKIQFEAGF